MYKNIVQLIFSIGLILPTLALNATCLEVNGLEFKQIDKVDFLASREGKNIAILSISYDDKENIQTMNTWEFFTGKICSGYGANAYFMLNEKKTRISILNLFK